MKEHKQAGLPAQVTVNTSTLTKEDNMLREHSTAAESATTTEYLATNGIATFVTTVNTNGLQKVDKIFKTDASNFIGAPFTSLLGDAESVFLLTAGDESKDQILSASTYLTVDTAAGIRFLKENDLWSPANEDCGWTEDDNLAYNGDFTFYRIDSPGAAAFMCVPNPDYGEGWDYLAETLLDADRIDTFCVTKDYVLDLNRRIRKEERTPLNRALSSATCVLGSESVLANVAAAGRAALLALTAEKAGIDLDIAAMNRFSRECLFSSATSATDWMIRFASYEEVYESMHGNHSNLYTMLECYLESINMSFLYHPLGEDAKGVIKNLDALLDEIRGGHSKAIRLYRAPLSVFGYAKALHSDVRPNTKAWNDLRMQGFFFEDQKAMSAAS